MPEPPAPAGTIRRTPRLPLALGVLAGLLGPAGWSAPAFAQGTSPPTPDVGVRPPDFDAQPVGADQQAPEASTAQNPVATAPGAQPAAEPEDLKARVAELYAAFRDVKDLLPFHLGAGLYLLYYQSLSNDSILSPGTYQGVFQIQTFYLKLDKDWKGIGGHIELRMRDSGHSPGGVNPELRSYFNANIWPQEVYAYYRPGRYFEIKAGKFYRRVGIFWDGSFFGNIAYYDGNKLNPDYGIGVEGSHDIPSGVFGLDYSAQFFYASDGVNGGYSHGRTVGTAPWNSTDAMDSAAFASQLRTYDPNPEGEQDSQGESTTTLRYMVTGRLVLRLQPKKGWGIELGGSGLTGVIDRISYNDMYQDQETPRFWQAGGDLTLRLGPVTIFGEYLHQAGPATRDAHYVLGGIHFDWKRLHLRVNGSWVRYLLSPDVDEFMVQPGIQVDIGGGLGILAEYDEWQRRDPRTSGDFQSYDRSLNFVLSYTY